MIIKNYPDLEDAIVEAPTLELEFDNTDQALIYSLIFNDLESLSGFLKHTNVTHLKDYSREDIVKHLDEMLSFKNWRVIDKYSIRGD